MNGNEVVKDIDESEKNVDKVLKAGRLERHEKAPIAQYILVSVMKNKSYEGIEYVEGLGRIPCGRPDFYGYRRLFYHLLDEELKRKADNREYSS